MIPSRLDYLAQAVHRRQTVTHLLPSILLASRGTNRLYITGSGGTGLEKEGMAQKTQMQAG